MNLLGKYGDFETDSDSDGFADGWSKGYSYLNGELSSGKVVIGNKSQHTWVAPNAGTYNQIRTLYNALQAGNKYFLSLWFYPSITPGYASAIAPGTPNESWGFEGSKTAGQFNKNYTSGISPYNTVLHIAYGLESPSSQQFDIWIDGAMLVNLTEMGQLPPPLKEYFNNVPSTWADLATESDITAIDGKKQSGNAWLNDLLPYVNGVGTLGYAWGV